MRKTFLTIIFISALIGSLVLVQTVKIAEAETLGPLKPAQYNYSSHIKIFSPQNMTYYTNSVFVNFTVQAFIEVGDVGYSLNNEPIQRVTNLTFVKSEPSNGYSPNGVTNDVTYEGSLYISDLENGNHSITIYQGAMYSDGYHEYTHTCVNFTVNSAPPAITNLSIENRTYNQTALSLNFIVDKEISWVGYSLDSQVNVTLTGNSTLSGLPDGAHSIVVYANDTSGNMGKSDLILFSVEIEQNSTPITSPTQTPTQTEILSPTSTSQQPAQKPETSGNSNAPFEIGIVVAISTVAAVIAVGTVIALRRRKRK